LWWIFSLSIILATLFLHNYNNQAECLSLEIFLVYVLKYIGDVHIMYFMGLFANIKQGYSHDFFFSV
jgi:hypothetical protein